MITMTQGKLFASARMSTPLLISVTSVNTTPDLKFAKIYVSVLDKSQETQVLKGLKSAGGYLRRELGQALQLRYTPELTFVADDSIAEAARPSHAQMA